jgi:hypothetical protein
MAFDPLERDGYVWIKAKLLLAGLILMEDDKASPSSLARLAEREGWESQKIGLETYYLVSERQLETRLGLENLTACDFNGDGDITRLVSKTITVNTLGGQLVTSLQAQLDDCRSTEHQLRNACASTEHQLSLQAAELLEKGLTIDTLNRKLAEAEKELLLTEHWKHTAGVLATTVDGLRTVIERMPGVDVVDKVLSLVEKQGDTLDKLLTATAVTPVVAVKPVDGTSVSSDYLACLDAAIELAKNRVPARPRRLWQNMLRFGYRVVDQAQVSLNPADYTDKGERDAILASSGQGKSYLMGVLMEETLDSGKQLMVIDPEGEHHTLNELYPVLVMGGDFGDIALPEVWPDVIQRFYETGISVVYDLSDLLPDEKQAVYAAIGRQVMLTSQAYRSYLRIVIDECHLFAPQTGGLARGQDTCLSVSKDIASLGRKRGVHSMWASQRPAKVHKDVLSQCNRFWVGGINIGRDFDGVKDFVEDAGVTLEQLKALERGQFYLLDLGAVHLVASRKRFCRHGGATPGQVDEASKKPAVSKPVKIGLLSRVSVAVIDSLRRAFQ